MSDAPPYPSPTRKWHNKAQPATLPSRPELSAHGKAIVITGGGSTGIGGETARYFAAAGARRIALLGRRSEPLLDNKAYIEQTFPNVDVVAIPTDVTCKDQVDAAFSSFGAVDVLIHAAAAVGPKETVADADAGDFLGAINTNLAGAFYVAQAFLRHASSEAVVVAINSWGAHLSLNDAFASYCVAKMAVYRLWDTVAIANPHLRVFHTQPGVVLTEMNLSVGGAESFKDVKVDDAAFNLWLASPEARFLTGKFLWCNWDVEELISQRKEIEHTKKFNIDLGGWPFTDELETAM